MEPIVVTKKELDFKVVHPQLESQPGEFRSGLRRFKTQKNETSPALILPGGPISMIPNSSKFLSSGPLRENPKGSFSPKKEESFYKYSPKTIIRNDPLLSEHQSSKSNTSDVDPYDYKKALSRSIAEDFPIHKFENSRANSGKSISASIKDISLRDMIKHPVFQVSRYTKQNPKLVMNNPITGIPVMGSQFKDSSLSPDRKRGMADYGNLMLSNGIRPPEASYLNRSFN